MSHAEGRTCEEIEAEADAADEECDRLRSALAAARSEVAWLRAELAIEKLNRKEEVARLTEDRDAARLSVEVVTRRLTEEVERLKGALNGALAKIDAEVKECGTEDCERCEWLCKATEPLRALASSRCRMR